MIDRRQLLLTGAAAAVVAAAPALPARRLFEFKTFTGREWCMMPASERVGWMLIDREINVDVAYLVREITPA
jgi:hypothetical protein